MCRLRGFVAIHWFYFTHDFYVPTNQVCVEKQTWREHILVHHSPNQYTGVAIAPQIILFVVDWCMWLPSFAIRWCMLQRSFVIECMWISRLWVWWRMCGSSVCLGFFLSFFVCVMFSKVDVVLSCSCVVWLTGWCVCRCWCLCHYMVVVYVAFDACVTSWLVWMWLLMLVWLLGWCVCGCWCWCN